MSADAHLGVDRVTALREAFDQSFAEAPLETAALEDLLEVRLGTALYALRVTEISGLFADVPITPLPSPVSVLLGITAVRGVVLPVYDLRALLGYAADVKPRWLATAAAAPVALAFDAFDRHLRILHDAIVPHPVDDSVVRHVSDVVQLAGRTRPIISVSSVLAAITSRVRAAAPEKE